VAPAGVDRLISVDGLFRCEISPPRAECVRQTANVLRRRSLRVGRGLCFPDGRTRRVARTPDKTDRDVPARSANDAAARIFADALGKKWGKPVVVEDKPGAEGTIGVGAFVAAQDDHTLLYTVAGSVTVAPLLIDKLPYDVERDLQPIAATTAIVLTLAVSNDLPVRSIPELIDVLRSNPGKYAWTSGPTLPRYVFAAFLKRNGLQMNFVSYRDASQPQADLGEGRIKALVTSLTASSSGADRKSPLSRGHKPDARCRVARSSDCARTRPSRTRN
jgi:hypothetical protein